MLDPAKTRGTIAAQVAVNLELARDDVRNVTYSVNADLTNFVGEGLLLGQKVEAQSLRVIADSKAFQAKGDARINGTPAALEFHQVAGEPLADLRLHAVLDDAARRRLGINFGTAVSGNVPVTLAGRIGADDSKNQLECRRGFHAGGDRSVIAGLDQACGQASAVKLQPGQEREIHAL